MPKNENKKQTLDTVPELINIVNSNMYKEKHRAAVWTDYLLEQLNR